MIPNDITRREAMKTALKAGVYAAPVIASAVIPVSGVAAATPPGPRGSLTIALAWGALPTDMDAHLTGPDVLGGGRFEVFWDNMMPVPYASLDQDVQTGFGPETITVQRYTATNQFVPGDYHFFVDNYSAEVGYNLSNASVTVSQSGTQITQFLASNATGSPAAEWWQVFNFTLATDGTPTITPIMTLTDTTPSIVIPKPRKHH